MKPKLLADLPPDVRAHANPLLSRIRDKKGPTNSLARLYTWGQGKQIKGQDLRDLLLALVAGELLDQDDEFKSKGRAVLISESDTFTITAKGIARLEALGQPEPAPALRPSASPAAVAAARTALGLPAVVPPPAPTQNEPISPTLPPPAPGSGQVETIEPAPESGTRQAEEPAAALPVAQNDTAAPVSGRKSAVSSEPPASPAAPHAGLTAAPTPAVQAPPAGLPVWLSLPRETLLRAADIVRDLVAVRRKIAYYQAEEARLIAEAAQLDAGSPVVDWSIAAEFPPKPTDERFREAEEQPEEKASPKPVPQPKQAEAASKSEPPVLPRGMAEVLALLDAEPTRSWTAPDVARESGLPRSSCVTYLTKLTRMDLIERPGHGVYRSKRPAKPAAKGSRKAAA